MIETRRDARRGCGWRKPGGLYLVAEGVPRPCGRLPIPLTQCPTCGHGIKFSRSWTWVDVAALLAQPEVDQCRLSPAECAACPLGAIEGRQGLIWIGESFYKRPIDWLMESDRQGVCRRIQTVPNDFELGKTWVLVAHKKAILEPVVLDGEGKTKDSWIPAIFHAFLPQAIEYVVAGDESEEELQKLLDRGITPVRIEHVEEEPEGQAEGGDDA